MKAKEESDDFESQCLLLGDCNIILGTDIPELLNGSWQLLSNHQSKLQTLRQDKICLEVWKKYIDSREAIQNIMQNDNEGQQRDPSNQSLQQTPTSALAMGTQNSSTSLPHSEESQRENEKRIAVENEKKQQKEQLLKFNADFVANLLIEQKKFERKKELKQQLEL